MILAAILTEIVPTAPVSTPSSTAGIITAASALTLVITALAGLVTAVAKIAKPLRRVAATTQHIHNIVNGQRTAMQIHIRDLHKVLSEHGIAIPDYPPEIANSPPSPGAP